MTNRIRELDRGEPQVLKDIASHAKAGRTESARLLAKTLADNRKVKARLYTSKAQLASVQMQITEAFAMRKIETSLKTSASVMKNVNSLVRLSEVTDAMREVSKELTKAGIIEEMVSDSIDVIDPEQATEDELEVVIQEALNPPEKATKTRVAEKKAPQPLPQQPVEEEVEHGDMEPSLADMRGRLEALKS